MFREGDDVLMNDPEYLAVVDEVKARITSAQHRARMAASYELVRLYWELGAMVNEHSRWGSRFIENLSRDIRRAYPEVTGFSERNLRYMARFAATYPDLEILQPAVAELPWTHHIILLDKVKDPEQRTWYALQASENGWSKAVLARQIDTGLYQRQVKAAKTTNFEARLPSPQSDLAQQMVKDPYVFDFIEAEPGARERDIERQMVADVTRLLLELGSGFAFVGRQFHVEVSGQDYYIDLLFYQLKLRCFVVVELKAVPFEPAFAGQLNFYVSAVDDLVRSPGDQPTIGLLLCQSKDRVTVEYSLRRLESPIGVAEYRLVRELPSELAGLLPSTDDIASRIDLGEAAGL